MIEVAISKGLEVRGRQAFTWSGRPIRIGRDSESEIKISGLGFMRFSAEISVGPMAMSSVRRQLPTFSG